MQRMVLVEQRLARFLDAKVQVWHRHIDSAAADSRPLLSRIGRWLGHPVLTSQPVRSARPDHSLTHAGKSMFAVAVKSGGFSGIGIDFEPWRVLDQRHQRLMLTARESTVLGAATAQNLLRIWTVKEACFKADAGGQQRWVTAYALDNPAQKSGGARSHCGRQVHHFRYISMEVPGGILSVAFKKGVLGHE